MNFDELQNTWNSPANHLPTAQQRILAEKFARQMIRRRRFRLFWLIHTFAWLTIITVIAASNLMAGKTNPALEWGLFPLLIVPWGFAIHFLRRHLKSTAPIADGGLPMIDSLRAARESNREAQSHLRIVGVLFLVAIPFLALSIQQLHAVGKVSARELVSMAVLLGAVLLLSGAGVAARYFGRLRPQQKQLDGLLAELSPDISS